MFYTEKRVGRSYTLGHILSLVVAPSIMCVLVDSFLSSAAFYAAVGPLAYRVPQLLLDYAARGAAGREEFARALYMVLSGILLGSDLFILAWQQLATRLNATACHRAKQKHERRAGKGSWASLTPDEKEEAERLAGLGAEGVRDLGAPMRAIQASWAVVMVVLGVLAGTYRHGVALVRASGEWQVTPRQWLQLWCQKSHCGSTCCAATDRSEQWAVCNSHAPAHVVAGNGCNLQRSLAVHNFPPLQSLQLCKARWASVLLYFKCIAPRAYICPALPSHPYTQGTTPSGLAQWASALSTSPA
jgi:hypothetical protein